MKVHVVYLLIPTSNHNKYYKFQLYIIVVYLLIPTSNHNQLLRPPVLLQLYIF